MAKQTKAPPIKTAKKAAPKKSVNIYEQPDETEKIYDEEQFIESIPEENIIQDEPSIADILKKNKAN